MRLFTKVLVITMTVFSMTLVSLPSSAKAGVSIGAVGALTLAKESSDVANISFSSKLGFGGGATFGIGFGASGVAGLEIDGIYVERKYDITVLGIVFPASISTFHVPVLFRLNTKYISVGAGGFMSFLSASTTSTDYGLVGSLKFMLPFSPKVSFVADGRYNYGLANLLGSASTNKETSQDIFVLAGLQFML